MPKDPQEFADLFGAKIVGEVPDVGGGPFGMARLAHIMHRRLTPSQGERPGRPTDSTWAGRPKVPMSEATQRRLAEIAEEMSTPERRVSPMQVAAQLLEEAVSRVEVKTKVPPEEIETDPKDLAASEEVKIKPMMKTTDQNAEPTAAEMVLSERGKRGSRLKNTPGTPGDLTAKGKKKIKRQGHPVKGSRPREKT